MSIFEYIEKYKDYSFKEKEITEIDLLLFSSLSYINYKEVLNTPMKVELSIVGYLIFKNMTKKEISNSIPAVRTSMSILESIMNTKRYKDVKLYNYVYKFNDKMQYSSLFFDIDKKTTVISYEGTDELISGWYEDGELAYHFPVPAHRLAINTLNKKVSIFSMREYYLVGHSKGGNLAMVAGMYAKDRVYRRIKKIYSFDGPGLRDEEFKSKEFKKILPKYELIIPNYSIVGLLLNEKKDYKVIKSTYHGPYAHDLISWCVEDDHFEKAELSKFSEKLNNGLTKWMNALSNIEREQFMNDMFNILNRANINTLYDIKGFNFKNIFKIISEYKKIDVKTEEILKDLFKSLYSEIKD